MKKMYQAPKAEVLTFAKEDIITASGILNTDWNLPSIDLGNPDWNWDDGLIFKL